ncbi:unnamed protein product, partial [Prorocentrum cordatum]
ALRTKLASLRAERDSTTSASQKLLVASSRCPKIERQVAVHGKNVGPVEKGRAGRLQEAQQRLRLQPQLEQ